MTISRMISRVLLTSALFTTAACGDEAGNSTPIQDLSPAERETECQTITETIDVSRFETNQRALTCYASGSMSDACDEVVAECMEGNSSDITIEGGVSCEDISSWNNCKASSAELIACYKALDSHLAKQVNGITCANAMERMMQYASQAPAACAKLEEKCPDAFDSGDDDGWSGDSDWSDGDFGGDWGDGDF